jgi:hypothetical protein
MTARPRGPFGRSRWTISVEIVPTPKEYFNSAKPLALLLPRIRKDIKENATSQYVDGGCFTAVQVSNVVADPALGFLAV